MKETESPMPKSALGEMEKRLRNLEEKFEYQDRTIDALNDVIIEQQSQLEALCDQILRLRALLTAGEEKPGEGEDPPPPHY